MTRLDTRTHRAWTRDNPVLADGEIVAEKETRRLKIGDGVTRYNSLPFVGAGATPSTPSAPFNLTRDAIESKLYDKAYSWELVPGSDVMATTVGVLPKIGTDGSNRDVYAGLVTVDHVLADPADYSNNWDLYDPATAITVNFSAGEAEPGSPAGAYLAYYAVPAGDPPPYAFPEGWTPGNTTGSGPVLPKVGSSGNGSYSYWAGLVEVAPDAPDHESTWSLFAPDSPLTFDFLDNASHLDGPFTPGIYLVALDSAPTTLPEGWTVRPYGIGQVAITDENAGGLIGDVAYVVSGWTFNDSFAGTTYHGVSSTVTVVTAAGTNIPAGTIFTGDPNVTPLISTLGGGNINNVVYKAKVDLTVTEQSGYLYLVTAADHDVWVGLNETYLEKISIRLWPFIERFDLRNKRWLSRIPLPDMRQYAQPWVDTGSTPYPHTTLVTRGGKTWRTNVGYGGVNGDEVPGVSELWIEVASPVRFGFEAGIAGVIDGKLYFGGGDGDMATGKEFFVYDPVDESITRLADMDADDYPDYTPYGVVGGKLWYSNTTTMWAYDPIADSWTSYETDVRVSQYAGDQVQGFEIDGKLWFVYDGKAFVFDPVALTVEAKAVNSTGRGAAFLVEGNIQIHANISGTLAPPIDAVYNVVEDFWTTRTDFATQAPTHYDGESVTVTYKDTPYILTGVQLTPGLNTLSLGVYGLTGVALDKPQPQRFDEADDAAAISAALEAAEEQFVDFKIYSASPAIGGSFINASVVPVRMAKPRSGESVSQAVSIPLAEFAQDAPVFYARVKDTTQDPKLTASLTVVVSDGATYYKTWAGYLTGDNMPDFYGSAVPLSVTASSGPPPHLTLDSSGSQVLTDAAASYTVSATLTLTRA